MKERPILFSGPMVRAILAGTKTQTRRLVRLPAHDWALSGIPEFLAVGPFGARGDRLWVREAWQVDAPRDGSWADTMFYGDRISPLDWIPERYRTPAHVLHRATWDDGTRSTALWWRPSIHMPRWASRLTLEVTEVRVQRLQDISEEDAKAEGVEMIDGDPTPPEWWSYRQEFGHLWDSLNAKRAPWDSNPWVWAVSFRRCV